jgi:membrane associated rhomboid family serine protease
MSPLARSRGYAFNWSSFITPAVKVIVIVCSAVYLLEALLYLIFSPRVYFQFILWFGLVPEAVTHGLRIWQPFTYLFVHDILYKPPLHLLLNMFMLWMFGRELEVLWGKRRFYTYFFVTGVGAGLVNVIIKTIPVFFGHAPSEIPTIGASGAVFGILIANAVLFPDRQIYLIPFPITIAMRPYVAVMAGIEFFGTLGIGGDGVSHICHLGGMLVGYLYLRRGTFLYGLRNSYTDWRSQRTRKRFEVFMNKHKKEPPSRPDNWVN